MCGHYSIQLDRTGFPLVTRERWPFYISLFPVSKVQYEYFLSAEGTQNGKYTDTWYRELISANPRCSWKEAKKKPWQLFLSGLSLDEIDDFLNYLGSGYRLPQKNEWQKLHTAASDLLLHKEPLLASIREYGQTASPVEFWIQKNLFPVTSEGLLERITDDRRNRFIGRPYSGLHGNHWNASDVRDMDNKEAIQKMAGFRIVLPKKEI